MQKYTRLHNPVDDDKLPNKWLLSKLDRIVKKCFEGVPVAIGYVSTFTLLQFFYVRELNGHSRKLNSIIKSILSPVLNDRLYKL